MKKNWFEIKAQAADANAPVEAFIYDEIGIWGTTARDFIAAIQPHKDKPITLRINSPGGSVWDGFAIYNYLSGLNVTTKIDGIAASMASIVALAGKRVEIAANGFLMIHNPAGGTFGDSKDMEKYVEMLKKVQANLSDTYQRETGASAEQVEKWMADETWFTASEAKAAGLVDDITDAISFSAKLPNFTKPPSALTTPVDSTPKAMATDNAEKTFFETLKAALGITAAAPVPASAPPEPPELIQARADLGTARQTIGTLEARVKTLEGEVATAKTEATTAKAEATKVASQLAAAITSGQGQPPIAAVPNPTPAASAKPDLSKLTGLEKAIAAHKASYETAK